MSSRPALEPTAGLRSSRDLLRRYSRRSILKLGAVAAAIGPAFLSSSRACAGQEPLRIAKWAHFVPGFDAWFDTMAAEWGAQHGTHVIVDHIPIDQLGARANAEVEAGAGHDLFMFPWPPAEFHEHVIDHRDIYQTVAFRYGSIDRLAHRSTYYVKAQKYFAFADSWIPAPLHYFEDYWADVDMPLGPVHWNGLRSGAARIRQKLGVPCGLALASGLESNITLHTLLCAFSSGVLDATGRVIIGNARTTVALQFVKDLFRDAGSPDQLTWGSAANVLAMLARKTSCTINGISLLRTAEKEDREVARKIRLQPPLLGSSGVAAVPFVTNCSAVWSFAQNPEGAKQFLCDLIDRSRAIYEKSGGSNFPFYQKTVPDLIRRLAGDPQADPPFKYTELKDALHWTHNLGVPGYATPAAMDVFNSFVIPRMFVSVVTGDASPEEATRAAEAEVTRIAAKWNGA